VQLLLDADGLIKLNRAGVLIQLAETHPCVIPGAVYDEVVTRGKVHLYPDADAIEAAVAGRVAVMPVQHGPGEPEFGLGAGERGILDLLPQLDDAFVVSDDRRFLTVLSMRGIAFLTPADMLVVLARQGVLTEAEARAALERLRPAIRTKAYWDARQDLESRGEGHEEE